MKNSIAASLAFIVVLCIQVNAQTLEKMWEVTGLEAPESIIHDSNAKMYYVSNVAGSPIDKDGNGYISKVDENGTVSIQKWVTGLNAPKGMGIHKGKLYVADIDAVAVIDIASGKIENTIAAEGAGFLNDIAVSAKGDVYISDTFGGNTIFRIQNGKIERWLQDEKLDFPNGLYIKGNDLVVASWGKVTNQETFETAVKGKLIKVSLSDKKISDLTTSFSNGDGVEAYKDGYLVSDWPAGKIFYVDGKAKVSEVGSYNSGTADIEYVTSQNLLLVPQMAEGKILAFKVR